LRDFYINSGV